MLAYLIIFMAFMTFLARAFVGLMLFFEEIGKTGRVPLRYYAMMLGLISGGLGMIGVGQGLRLLILGNGVTAGNGLNKKGSRMFVTRRFGLALVSSLLLSTAVLAQGRGGGVGAGQSGSSSVTQGSTSPTTDSGRSTTKKREKANQNSNNRRANSQNNPKEPNPQNKKLPTAYKVWRISPK